MAESSASFFSRSFRLWAAFLLAADIAAHADDGDQPIVDGSSLPSRSQATAPPPSWAGKAFRNGVVAVANPYGAEAGAQILEQGGNAIDAAVAIAYALNVVEPQSSGIGGGGFMMIHLARGGRTFSIDSREKAPAGATRDMFAGVPSPTLQGVAVGVPGMVRGTALALRRHGKFPLAHVMAPAIRFAEKGFVATPRYVATSCNPRSQNSPEAAAFFCPGGQVPAQGTLIVNKPLAATLRKIAANGPDCFYEVSLARGCDIALGVVQGQRFSRPAASDPFAKHGGSMTLGDLRDYRAVERVPIEGSYRGYRIKSMGPPSSGALTAIQILKMLEQFPLGDGQQGFGFGSVKTLNVMAEAMRLGFADRADWMGDADFAPVPRKGLIDDTYLQKRGAAIVPGVLISPNPLPGDPRPYDTAGARPAQPVVKDAPATGPENGTTHFSVVDRWGNMVSYSNTIESSHGIGVFAGYPRRDGSFRNFGFLLNNELTDFNAAPSTNRVTGEEGYNDVQPGKRPRSSMAPTMLFTPEGEPWLAFGSPGGASIINSVVNIMVNLIDHKMPLQEAIDAARISVASDRPSVTLEEGFPQDTIQGMSSLGYQVSIGEVGAVQAVMVDQRTGKQYGAADSRREGTVIGLPRQGGR